MSFDVAADAYDRFMGRYSVLLSPQLADLAAVEAGERVLDVGCGPGALTAEQIARVGAAAVATRARLDVHFMPIRSRGRSATNGAEMTWSR